MDITALVVSIFSLFVSILSFGVSMKALKEQKEYNRICERPIPYFFSMNYENEIGLEVNNYGKGILLIEKITFVDRNGKMSSSLYELMPKDIKWKNYLIISQNGILAIPPNEKKVIICLESDKEEEKCKARKALDDIVLCMRYKDIYGVVYNFEWDFKGSYLCDAE